MGIENNLKTYSIAPEAVMFNNGFALHLFCHGVFLGLIFGPGILGVLLETLEIIGGFEYFSHWIIPANSNLEHPLGVLVYRHLHTADSR